MVEIEYLISLSDQKEVKELGPISETDKQKLRKIYKSFSLDDAKRVKDAGAHAILVGEALIKSDNPGDKLRELV